MTAPGSPDQTMTRDRLVERYGAPRPWRRRILVLGCSLVFATFAAWLVWTIGDQATPQVSSALETYSISGEHTATAVLVVALADADVKATCKLRAYAEDHTVVGELSFTPDPSEGKRQVRDIRTERIATSVESVGCTAPGQNRPR